MGSFHPDPPDGVVHWPKCPWSYRRARWLGSDRSNLAIACQWAMARDLHKNPDLPASAASLLREYMILDPIIPGLREIRAMREAKDRR